MSDELLTLNIVIGDRTYRIKSEAENEEPVRNTVKLINDKILEFKTQFAGKDMQDYIAMVILWYASEVQNQESPLKEKALMDALAQLETKLDEQL